MLQIDLEKSRSRTDGPKTTGRKQSITIEEVDADSDDEADGDVLLASSKTAMPNMQEFEKLKREQVASRAETTCSVEQLSCGSMLAVGLTACVGLDCVFHSVVKVGRCSATPL